MSDSPENVAAKLHARFEVVFGWLSALNKAYHGFEALWQKHAVDVEAQAFVEGTCAVPYCDGGGSGGVHDGLCHSHFAIVRHEEFFAEFWKTLDAAGAGAAVRAQVRAAGTALTPAPAPALALACASADADLPSPPTHGFGKAPPLDGDDEPKHTEGCVRNCARCRHEVFGCGNPQRNKSHLESVTCTAVHPRCLGHVQGYGPDGTIGCYVCTSHDLPDGAHEGCYEDCLCDQPSRHKSCCYHGPEDGYETSCCTHYPIEGKHVDDAHPASAAAPPCLCGDGDDCPGAERCDVALAIHLSGAEDTRRFHDRLPDPPGLPVGPFHGHTQHGHPAPGAPPCPGPHGVLRGVPPGALPPRAYCTHCRERLHKANADYCTECRRKQY